MQDRILFLAFLGRGLGLWVGLVSSKGFPSLSVDLVRGVGGCGCGLSFMVSPFGQVGTY
jgi:hypothetical protein